MKKAADSRLKRQDLYRRMLLGKRAEVLEGLGMKFDTVARLGRVAEEDQAQISHDEFISLHLNCLDYEQLRLVDEALERLASGGYGVCLACDEPIPLKRLDALPWARYCVHCQAEMASELGPGHPPGGERQGTGRQDLAF